MTQRGGQTLLVTLRMKDNKKRNSEHTLYARIPLPLTLLRRRLVAVIVIVMGWWRVVVVVVIGGGWWWWWWLCDQLGLVITMTGHNQSHN